MAAKDSHIPHKLELTSRAEVPSSGVAFHGTTRDKARAIVERGFDPEATDRSEKHDEDFLVNVARENDVELPVNRKQSTFFYTTLDDAGHFIAPRLGECVLVVDVSSLPNPMAIGDSNAYDSVISWTPSLAPDRACNGPYTEDERAVAQAYIDSMTDVSSPTEIQAACERIERPELIIEGGITPSTVQGVIRNPLEH